MRPLCAMWTWYPQVVTERGRPSIRAFPDDKDGMGVEVKLQMLVDDLEATDPMSDDGGSPIMNVNVKRGQRLQYRLKLSIPDAKGGNILLATPVIDDVTIFYTQGTQFIQYNRLDEAP